MEVVQNRAGWEAVLPGFDGSSANVRVRGRVGGGEEMVDEDGNFDCPW